MRKTFDRSRSELRKAIEKADFDYENILSICYSSIRRQIFIFNRIFHQFRGDALVHP